MHKTQQANNSCRLVASQFLDVFAAVDQCDFEDGSCLEIRSHFMIFNEWNDMYHESITQDGDVQLCSLMESFARFGLIVPGFSSSPSPHKLKAVKMVQTPAKVNTKRLLEIPPDKWPDATGHFKHWDHYICLLGYNSRLEETQTGGRQTEYARELELWGFSDNLARYREQGSL